MCRFKLCNALISQLTSCPTDARGLGDACIGTGSIVIHSAQQRRSTYFGIIAVLLPPDTLLSAPQIDTNSSFTLLSAHRFTLCTALSPQLYVPTRKCPPSPAPPTDPPTAIQAALSPQIEVLERSQFTYSGLPSSRARRGANSGPADIDSIG